MFPMSLAKVSIHLILKDLNNRRWLTIADEPRNSKYFLNFGMAFL